MSKVVHPFAHRLGILRDWRHRWFATGPQYQDYLRQIFSCASFCKRICAACTSAASNRARRQNPPHHHQDLAPRRYHWPLAARAQLKLKNKITHFLKNKNLEVPEIKARHRGDPLARKQRGYRGLHGGRGLGEALAIPPRA